MMPLVDRTERSSKDGHPRQKRTRIPLKQGERGRTDEVLLSQEISQDRGEIFYTKVPRSIYTEVVETDVFRICSRHVMRGVVP